MKHDLARGATEVHEFGPGQMTLEPVFVQKAGAVAEDEGWVMCSVYDPERNASDVVILDAQDFGGEQVARIHLPARVPFGFHGAFVPDLEIAPA
jgi:carotenoid cleavage dioxygenase-like enzyme